MTETAPEAAAQDAPAQDAPPSTDPSQTDDTDWKAESRKWEQRAKENGAKAKEFEKQQQASMSDAERAVAEAEARGRTAATSEYGKKLAQTQFDALAGRRNPDVDTSKVLEFVDLARFLDENGEPDDTAIKSAVERLVPTPPAGTPSFDGGSRSTAAVSGDMNNILRKAAGLG